MKKFLSIFIALLLIVSLFATTAVAFAAEGDEVNPPATGEGSGDTSDPNPDEGGDEPVVERKVTIIKSKLDEHLAKGCAWFNNLKIEMGDRKFGEEMMKSSTFVGEVFQGINYIVEGDEGYTSDKKKENDKIYVEYCRPSESPKGQETWQNSVLITDNIRISSTGWYLFRFVVKDKDNNVISVDNPDAYLRYYAEDTSHPVVSLSTTMKNKQDSGLTAGAKYSIPTSGLTSGSTDEMSSTTVNFKIYKNVNKVETLIYDSKTKEITEGYEDFVDVDGAITPSNDDISDETVYIVEYYVTDAYGFVGIENKADVQNPNVEEYNPRMLLKVVAAPATNSKSTVSALEIVLFCIAGLSAIGIVVLLCIKPKEASPARAANSAKESEAVNSDNDQE